MEGQLVLRSATYADQPAIRALVFSVLESYGLKPSPHDTDADLEDLQQHYFSCGGDFAVLLDGVRVIGTVALANQGAGNCELRKMYLDPAYRGCGLGKQLMEHALQRARELGFGRMTLETATVLKEAVKLYEQYGFRSYQPNHLAARCDLAMERML